ncbi:Type III secretion thermoregulatory protein (LcrF,VirF) [Pseudomonas chlororaphis subsp. piscium]|uniref:helix-turn-helix domain-containing protein n=1 Tax=Pseudomonas chlororaphis TaxID=587753 RepID=UPI000F584F9D|nr:helix-turn-helix domain-containing protein [Pseudomonas chlororaphis]AZC51703.1 Type III secretion thermoregulatory protein (LcrF,VirF) [Pseudomonas chlororaphis subsp. piscium]
MTLGQWCSAVRSGEQVLRIRNGSNALCLAHRESSVRWCLAPEWQGLLVLRSGLQVVSGDAWVLALSQANLVKLQFFIDQGVVSEARSACSEPWAMLSEGLARNQSLQDLESWYLALALQGHGAYQAFAHRLRSSESYQLLSFLLEQGSRSEKLQDLARRYGVSVSHFRRLCRQALGGRAKSELRGWRMARALLSMTEGVSSITEVALEFGYASSSHFSKEIRELVGVTPSSLIDITRLSSE